ncbi:MAG: hypothetical protein KDK39_12055 [Leptospiraceae bacterium]|nr:hypothetical protein [Leptospiraceae bacterium]
MANRRYDTDKRDEVLNSYYEQAITDRDNGELVDWGFEELEHITQHQKISGYPDPDLPGFFEKNFGNNDWPTVTQEMFESFGIRDEDHSIFDTGVEVVINTLEGVEQIGEATGKIALQLTSKALGDTISAVGDMSQINDVADKATNMAFYYPQMKLYSVYSQLSPKEKVVFEYVLNIKLGTSGFGQDVTEIYTDNSKQPSMVTFGSLRGSHLRILNEDFYFSNLMDEMEEFGINIRSYERQVKASAKEFTQKAKYTSDYLRLFGVNNTESIAIRKRDISGY